MFLEIRERLERLGRAISSGFQAVDFREQKLCVLVRRREDVRLGLRRDFPFTCARRSGRSGAFPDGAGCSARDGRLRRRPAISATWMP